MDELYNVSTSPHIRGGATTAALMRDVIIALCLPSAFGIYVFGWRAAMIIAVAVASCVLTEYLWDLFIKRAPSLGDGSAIVTGLILALNLPSTVPVWVPVLGSVFAILVVKQFFGGLGQNFMNPALAARCFLLISFARIMTDFPVIDGVTTATPLALLRSGTITDPLTMLIGTHSGVIGETCAVAILIAGIFMIIRKVISIRIPLSYIGSFIVFVVVFKLIGEGALPTFDYLVVQLCGGGLLLGAFFMATDYVTSPITGTGKIIYGIVLGLLTALFRFFGSSAEGVSYAILVGNVVSPLIEKWTVPKAFGTDRKSIAAAEALKKQAAGGADASGKKA